MAGDEVDGLGPSRCRDGNYGISIADLRIINEQKGLEAVEHIQSKYGSVVEICNLLFTSPNEGEHKWNMYRECVNKDNLVKKLIAVACFKMMKCQHWPSIFELWLRSWDHSKTESTKD